MTVNKQYLAVGSLLVASLLASCGGGGSDSTSTGNTTGTNPQNETGVFIDGPVANLGYETETQAAVTNASGEFIFLPGEICTFSVGEIALGSASCAAVLTPLELANTQFITDQRVVNILRLLQSLDSDNQHSNGIQIPQSAITNSQGVNIDFGQSVQAFENDISVINFISNAGGGRTTLIPANVAQDNFAAAIGGDASPPSGGDGGDSGGGGDGNGALPSGTITLEGADAQAIGAVHTLSAFADEFSFQSTQPDLGNGEITTTVISIIDPGPSVIQVGDDVLQFGAVLHAPRGADDESVGLLFTPSIPGNEEDPPAFAYDLECIEQACTGVSFDPTSLTVTFSGVEVPPDQSRPNNLATAPIAITGTVNVAPLAELGAQ